MRIDYDPAAFEMRLQAETERDEQQLLNAVKLLKKSAALYVLSHDLIEQPILYIWLASKPPKVVREVAKEKCLTERRAPLTDGVVNQLKPQDN